MSSFTAKFFPHTSLSRNSEIARALLSINTQEHISPVMLTVLSPAIWIMISCKHYKALPPSLIQNYNIYLYTNIHSNTVVNVTAIHSDFGALAFHLSFIMCLYVGCLFFARILEVYPVACGACRRGRWSTWRMPWTPPPHDSSQPRRQSWKFALQAKSKQQPKFRVRRETPIRQYAVNFCLIWLQEILIYTLLK